MVRVSFLKREMVKNEAFWWISWWLLVWDSAVLFLFRQARTRELMLQKEKKMQNWHLRVCVCLRWNEILYGYWSVESDQRDCLTFGSCRKHCGRLTIVTEESTLCRSALETAVVSKSSQMQGDVSLQECQFLSHLVPRKSLLSPLIVVNLFRPENRPVTALEEVVMRDMLGPTCLEACQNNYKFAALSLLRRSSSLFL